jgi:hypothetical protein
MNSVLQAKRVWLALGGRLGSVLILAFVGGLLPVVYLENPERGGVFPPCPFRFVTGLKCPGCGTLRAIHNILHGDIAAGFRYNPLTVLLLPLAIWFVASHVTMLVRGRPLKGILLKPFWIWALFVLIIAYGVLRNIFPFLGG